MCCFKAARAQAYCIIRVAAAALELAERVSCNGLRKMFVYNLWKSGISPAVIMEIQNHSSFAVKRCYSGVCQDDKNETYAKLTTVL